MARCSVKAEEQIYFYMLQRLHEIESLHIEQVFTRRPHAHKLPMKVSFLSRIIICFYIIEHYEHIVRRKCCVFF